MAEATVVRLDREKALAVFLYCGWSSATSWPNKKIQDKIADIKEVLPDDKEPEEGVKETLDEILAGLEGGSSFEIVSEEGDGGSEEASDDKPKKEKKPKKKKEPKEKKPTWLTASIDVLKAEGRDKTDDELYPKVCEIVGKENEQLAKNHLRGVRVVLDRWFGPEEAAKAADE